MPMYVKSAHKAVHRGCINNVIWEFVPFIDYTIAESICPNIEPKSSFMQFKRVTREMLLFFSSLVPGSDTYLS